MNFTQSKSNTLTVDEFAELAAQGYNRIPVVLESLADLDTPLSTYLKLAQGPYSYLLESAQGGEKWGRYSIIGLPCRTVVTVHGFPVPMLVMGILTKFLIKVFVAVLSWSAVSRTLM